jgi:phosphatidylserine decarboxylase
VRIAPEGWIVLVPLLVVCAAASAALLIFAWPTLGVAVVLTVALALLALWGLWFFRDPHRPLPQNATADSVISPADGKVIKLDQAPLPRELAQAAVELGLDPLAPLPRVSIFLNLFDVHVNRTVAAGQIVKLAYSKGAFVNASFDKASTHNERNAALMQDPAGRVLAFSQIAGLVARRIVCHLREGQTVAAGERFGLIRFGSRAEIWMPAGTRIGVTLGQRVVAGQTILGQMPDAPSSPSKGRAQ